MQLCHSDAFTSITNCILTEAKCIAAELRDCFLFVLELLWVLMSMRVLIPGLNFLLISPFPSDHD